MDTESQHQRTASPSALAKAQLPIIALIAALAAMARAGSGFGFALVLGAAALVLACAAVSVFFGMRHGLLAAMLAALFFMSPASSGIDGLSAPPARMGISLMALATAALFGTAEKFRRRPEEAAADDGLSPMFVDVPGADANQIIEPVMPSLEEPPAEIREEAEEAHEETRLLPEAHEREAPAGSAEGGGAESVKKEEFMDIARRELAPPLSKLEKYISAFKYHLSTSEDEKAKTYVRKIESQYRHLDKAMQKLLQFARIDFDSMPMKIDRFDIEKLFAETVEALQKLAREHTIVFLPSVSSYAVGDRFKVRKVLDHLMRNAMKYSPNGGKVVVGLTEEEDRFVAYVRDFGVGIEAEHLGQISASFAAPVGDRQKKEGLGVGLYTCNEIIRRLGGEMWVNGRRGKGSAFYFTVPKSGARNPS